MFVTNIDGLSVVLKLRRSWPEKRLEFEETVDSTHR
jgi:hypothetical protein